MSHYFAIVLIHENEGPDDVAKLLAPWNEDRAYNEGREDGWWDWYRIGGRWDGRVRGVDGYAECPNCAPYIVPGGLRLERASIDCSYGPRHESWDQNHVPVAQMGEVLPFTIVRPDGSFAHKIDWKVSSDPDPEWHKTVGSTFLAHRDCVAVGVDYHS